MPFWFVFVIIGLVGGFAAGLFGVGGGIVIVPALGLLHWLQSTQSDRNQPGGAAAAHWAGCRHRVLSPRQRRCPRGDDPRGDDDPRHEGGDL